MSVLISSPEQIMRNCLNTSSAKALYSIPKAKRFKDYNKPLCDSFYNTRETKSLRKAGFGYGNKTDFTKLAFNTPGPNQYFIKNFFDVKREKNLGPSFGESRSKMSENGIIKTRLNKVPGLFYLIIRPGTYESKSQLSDIKYSLRPKTQNADEYSTIKINPGPGQYEKIETINKMGNIFVSKYKSSGATVINPVQSKRFFQANGGKTPGPGQYAHFCSQMHKTGNYFVSKYQNSMARTFNHNARHGVMESIKEQIPGVGNYRLPSEFGQYESSNKK